jgi:hypothetical protein
MNNQSTYNLKQLKQKLSLGLTLTNNTHDQWTVFLEDASHPGKYRHQTFRKYGFAGHSTHDSLDEALNDAFNRGFCCVDESALDRACTCADWNKGPNFSELLESFKAKEITERQYNQDLQIAHT